MSCCLPQASRLTMCAEVSRRIADDNFRRQHPSLTGGSYDIFIMLLVCGAMLTIGMLFGGYRIINTVGNKIFKLKPFHSVVEQISTGVMYTRPHFSAYR